MQQHGAGIAKIRGEQQLPAQDVEHGNGKECRADAMAGDVKQVEGERIPIQHMVAEAIAADEGIVRLEVVSNGNGATFFERAGFVPVETVEAWFGSATRMTRDL